MEAFQYGAVLIFPGQSLISYKVYLLIFVIQTRMLLELKMYVFPVAAITN